MKFIFVSSLLVVASAASYNASPPLTTPSSPPPASNSTTDDCNSKCYVDVLTALEQQSNSTANPIQRIVFDSTGSITRCRTVVNADAVILRASNATEILNLQCYSQYGCGGEPIANLAQTIETTASTLIKTCRLVVPCGAPVNTTAPAPKDTCEKGVNQFPGVPPPPPPSSSSTNDTKTHAAVLFDGVQLSGEEHWIDGKIGDCRGLSGVTVGSVRTINAVGADPFTAGVDDTFTLAFFDNYNCAGNLIGAVTGSTPTTVGVINGKPLSVRFVQTGLNNSFYSMSYTGADNSTISTESSSASRVDVFGFMALVSSLVALLI